MGARFELSGVTPVDASGNPYPLGTLNFYVTGTTTPTNCYSNAGLTSALANPYTLGSDGKFPDIFTTQVRTKIVFKNAAGSTITTWDPVDKSLEEISASAAPTPAYPGLRYYNTSDGHRYRRDSANSTWIDEGLVDSLGNASTTTQTLAGTDTASFVTPDALGALWNAGTDIAAGATLSLPSTGGGVFNVTGASTTIGAISAAAEGREVELILANAQTITHGSGINTLTGETTKLPAGSHVRARRNASDWTITTWTAGPFQGLGGCAGLVLTNNASTPTTKGDITADFAVLLSATNAWCVKHNSVSVTVNLGTTGANGLDTGVQALSTWYHFYLISDGVTVAGLASTSATAPTMPSGYKYKLRVGAMWSGAATTLFRTRQVGRDAFYTPVAGSNTTAMPVIVAPANSQTRTAASIASVVPTTATKIKIALSTDGTANSGVAVFPDQDTGWANTVGNEPMASTANSTPGAILGDLPVLSTSIAYTSGSAASTHTSIGCYGWTDKVAAI